ncbi:WecB/TagA/CpsF family glycosyltransferase [Liquorilactobacillus vini]|uniref:N-acetylglucosaminyldiphosphoundecaprenol N-acetyl-beta-D-mannosaminyltransferase n=1 Tax=Liquorilactobacillus vini DSM 20605 TaxID=1133569 RepID=A0A0R2BY87_9LACO|nr:WecB/TagA/CpsF family glycosyltransferase [Liquorilactobacillus vini]KRM84257.1 N-acetylglucosaminyldiphosphoundecaprenol N-acetyl-beta-D-mannosaminyltransferase [Liquorilactobacillus vini DSM 20605]
MSNIKRIPILGINFDCLTNAEFFQQLQHDLNKQVRRFIVTANPEIVLYARQHPQYAQIIKQADYVTADGTGIVIGSKLLKHPLPERVTGFDTMNQLLHLANEQHKKVYFLGAKPEVLKITLAVIQKNYPHLIIAGAHDGYFKTAQPIRKSIQQANPDIVFVALGFPKQETFIYQSYQNSHAIWMGVGGSFDVLAGKVKRAPIFWQQHQIEWLYRLLQEPSRLPRMMALPKYLCLILAKKFHLIKK